MNEMAPESSPMGEDKRVRRVNNLPMIIIGLVVLSFLLVMMFVALKRAGQNIGSGHVERNAKSSSMFAKAILGDHSGGIIKPSQPPAIPKHSKGTRNSAGNMQQGQALMRQPQPISMGNREEDKIRLARLQRLEQAAQAKTDVRVAVSRNNGSGQTTSEHLLALRGMIGSERQTNSIDQFKKKLAAVKNLLGKEAGGDTSSGKSTYAQFGGSAGDRWQLDSTLNAPRSPYELRAGFVIPAILISGINSELPGQIMAQVAQSVYDTPTGKNLLIPQGSRLVGSYASEVAYGQSRVLIAWQRIIFPDGKALDIGSMPGGNSAGYSGFHDQVNNHYLRIFGSAILMSGVVAGISLSQNNNSSSNINQQRAGDVLSASLGQQLGQVTANMIQKNMNISPTITIRPGYRFNVIVTKDLTFERPYQPFDYSTKEERP